MQKMIRQQQHRAKRIGSKIISSIFASLSSGSGRETAFKGVHVLFTMSPAQTKQVSVELIVEHEEQPWPRTLPQVLQELFISSLLLKQLRQLLLDPLHVLQSFEHGSAT
jgi:hypothetical protein